MPKRKAADAVERLLTVLKAVFDLYDEEPEKIVLIFSEGGLSIRMLKGSEGQSLMTLPGMVKLVDLFTELFTSGRRRGLFRDVSIQSRRARPISALLRGSCSAGYCQVKPVRTTNQRRQRSSCCRPQDAERASLNLHFEMQPKSLS